MPRIVYLVPNLADPAVARRIAMLQAGGAEVAVAGFLRAGAALPALDVLHCVCLGHTVDGQFAQRVAAVVGELMRVGARLATWAAPDLIIARNLEMLPLARRLQRHWSHRPRLVYECLDIHRLLLRPDWVGRALRSAERHWAGGAALLITSSPAFLRQYFDAHSRLPTLLVENKVLQLKGAGPPAPRAARPDGVIRIGWFGALRCQRSLDGLCALARRYPDRVEIVLRGRPALREFRDFHAQVTQFSNLRFLGPYTAADLPQIYADVDFAWAIDFFEAGQNSAWLLPNRLYEGCLFGAVPIAVAGTETAVFLVRHDLGIVLPDITASTLEDMVARLTPARANALAAAVAQCDAKLFSFGAQDCRELVARLACLSNTPGASCRSVGVSRTGAPASTLAAANQPAKVPRVDICICTFRRPHLAQTLGSIAAIDPVGAQIRVLVADNDTQPTAAALVEAQRADCPFPLLYLHAPSANISLARNRCLEHAAADFIAFVDDDELVTHGWLRALLGVAAQTQADAVLGPVRARYEPDAPAWQREGDFHSTMPVTAAGEIRTGYTCNVLLRCTEAIMPMRFDLALGQTGGEDTEFFYRLTDAGGRIAFASEALVEEPVPASRATLGWLIRRRFRSGQTYGARLLATGQNRPRAVALAGFKAGFCLGITLATIWSPIAWRRNLLRAVLHLGVVAGVLGSRQAQHYGT